jgi:hypothetical protein
LQRLRNHLNSEKDVGGKKYLINKLIRGSEKEVSS